MTHASRCILFAALSGAVSISAVVQAQSTDTRTQQGAVQDSASHYSPGGFTGDWQVSWQGRLGTEQCMLHLEKNSEKITGNFRSVHGLSTLSGTVNESHITFDVEFQGPRPYTIRFTGNLKDCKLEGTSQAQGIGGSGAYLGHAGEVVQPEHPWTAKRPTNDLSQSRESGAAARGAASGH